MLEVEKSTKQEESAEVTPSQTNVQQPAETPPLEIAPDRMLHSLDSAGQVIINSIQIVLAILYITEQLCVHSIS